MLMTTALISAAVGILPLVFARRFIAAPIYFVLLFLALWGIYYVMMPSTIWPMLGLPGFCTFVAWCVMTLIARHDTYKHDRAHGVVWLPPVLYVLAMMWSGIAGSGIFYASHYAGMIGTIERHTWSDDVQPKDPRHMRMVSTDTALYLAQKAVANAGAIGSQFLLDKEYITLQRVKNELVYVIPFDFTGFSTWTGSKGVPAYITIDAEDPERKPQVVTLTGADMLRFTPGAYFDDNLTRHLRNSGFVNDGLTSPRFELDENGKPHWIVSTYKPTAWWWGEAINGIATIDPSTGEIVRYSVADAPEWIDRIYPADFVQNYADMWGTFSGGFWNSFWDKQGLTQTETPHLIYGENNKAEWVIGIGSKSGNDDSLIGIIYTDSRTGKSIYYETNGGATDTAVLRAVDNNQDVLFKHLHGVAPQIYNVYGSMAAVVPLVNPTDAFQGVAIVQLTDIQNVAVGATQSEALRSYQAIIYRSGQQIALDKTATVKELNGVVDRISHDPGSTGSVYLFHIVGVPRIFTASSGEFVKLTLTQPGDNVTVTFIASDQDQVPAQKFDNLSLPLEKSAQQEEVAQASAAKQAIDATRETTKDLSAAIENMTPEQQQKLLDSLKQP